MAGTSKVSTSLVVDFGSTGDAQGILKAEIDSDPAGLNAGETSFVPGDTAGYIVAKSSNVTVAVHMATYGAPVYQGTRAFRHEEIITFTGEPTSQPEYPILGNFSYSWLGINPGTLSATETDITLSKSAGVTEAVGVALISYDTEVELYTITSPTSLGGVVEFSIVIYLKGTAS